MNIFRFDSISLKTFLVTSDLWIGLRKYRETNVYDPSDMAEPLQIVAENIIAYSDDQTFNMV
jgi:hypothetical protein